VFVAELLADLIREFLTTYSRATGTLAAFKGLDMG
jgi:hypothetical protein